MMPSKRSSRADVRDEELGRLLADAAEILSAREAPDLAAVYERVEARRGGKTSRPLVSGSSSPRSPSILRLAVAASALFFLGFLFLHGSSSGFARNGVLYSREVALLADRLAGYEPLPLFIGAGSFLEESSPSALPPASGQEDLELSNFVNDLWNRDNG